MRKIMLVSLFLVIGLTGEAQSLKIGIFADPMISWLSADSRVAEADGVKFGIDGGLLLDKYFQKNYAFQTGISIGTQGGKILFTEDRPVMTYGTYDTLYAGTSLNYKINFITLPLGLKLKTNEIGYFSYFTRLGFTNQFSIGTRGTSSDGSLNKDPLEGEIFLYNLSYYFGIGMMYSISKDTALSIGLNYNNGFINLSKDDATKMFSRSVSLRLGIIF
jgi:hypothetical protein